MKQDGVYVICELFEKDNHAINILRYKEENRMQIRIIVPKVKKETLRHSDRFFINKTTLFLEIENAANYMKNRH